MIDEPCKATPSVILLIDDDPVLGPVTIELLQTLGHRASWLESYERARDVLGGAHDATIVLLDLQLGPLRGESLILELRAAGIRVPPLVIFSAQPMRELHEAATQIQAAGILQKPCNAAAIDSAIRAAALAA